jgi:hypothetical protein
MGVTKIPIACLLSTDTRDDRITAWTELIRATCHELTPIDRGIRGRFAPTSQDELERLVAGERACCGWADWTVSVEDDEIVLVATAADEPGPQVLRQLFRL